MARLAPEAVAALKATRPLDTLITDRAELGKPTPKGLREGRCLCAPSTRKKPLWVDPASGTWGCFKGGCGGDVFDYLQRFEGLDFRAAIERLGGAEGAGLADPAAMARAEAERERQRLVRAVRAEAEAAAARVRAWDIWRSGVPARGTLAEAYLAHRGLSLPAVPSLRFSAEEPYWAPDSDGRAAMVHAGPCLLAALQAPGGGFSGVHRTWIDPALATPGGKARIVLPDGTPGDAKKMRGIKKRAAIRLSTAPPANREAVLVAGEGIETTLSALEALERFGTGALPYRGWAAGDLGNLSGGTRGASTPHPDRPGRWVPSREPDLDDPGMMPPPWAACAILLGDGDSDAAVTAARLACCKARWEAAGCPTDIRMAPAGRDFNDLVRA